MKLFQVGNSLSWGKHIRVWGHGIPYPRFKSKESELWRRRHSGLTEEETRCVLQLQYEAVMQKAPDFNAPKTLSEKLNWLKIYYRNPQMTICADKVKARAYFSDKVADDARLLVKQLAVCKSFEEIDFSALPAAFVLKSNWGSGAQVIVKDKNAFNPELVRSKVNEWMKPRNNHYYAFLEWGYKDIEPRIVVEEFLDYEYKLEFFCFNGCPKFFWIVKGDKTKEVAANFYDIEWRRLPLRDHYPNFIGCVDRPECYEKMLESAKLMSAEFPFVRCDFYVTADGFRFSEMTFYHWAGYSDFKPVDYDLLFGQMLELPLH